MDNMGETHDSMWKKKPSEKSVYVSEFVRHSFPVLNRNKRIRKVLDVACGNGLGVAIPLLERGLDVHCFDHHESAIKAVKKNAKGKGYKIQAKKANMFKRYPYKDNTFDATFCFQALYHGKLEQIMAGFAEIKRVTRKGGYFFGTMLRHEIVKFDAKKKTHYINITLPNGKLIKSYHRQDKSQPHLFYFLSKRFEYNVPHYYFEKNELKVILLQFFREVKIKRVYKKKDVSAKFWFIECRVGLS